MTKLFLGFLFFLIVLTGYSFVLKKYIYSRFLPLFVIACMTVSGYCGLLTRSWCALLPLLQAGGCACFAYIVFQAIRGKAEIRILIQDTVRDLFLFYLLSGLLFFGIMIMECIPGAYDNFNHWLLYPKYITLNGKLGSQSELTHYLNYYPGCPIWQSIFASFLHNPDKLIYSFFAARLVATAAIFVCFIPTGRITWKQNLYFLLLTAACIFFFMEFSFKINGTAIPNTVVFAIISLIFVFVASRSGITKRDRNRLLGMACILILFFQLNMFLIGSLVRLVVDPFLGLVLAATCYFYWLQVFPISIRHRKPLLFLWGVPVLFYFLLIKNSSLILCPLFFIMSICWFFYPTKEKKRGKKILHYALPFVILILTCVFLCGSWKLYLCTLRSQFMDFESQKKEMTISNIYTRLTDKTDQKTQAFIADFYKGSVTTPMIGKRTTCSSFVSVVAFMVFALTVSVLLSFLSPMYRRYKRDCIGLFSFNLIFVLNFFFLLIGFIFLFQYMDNLTKPFTARYVAQFLYAWLCLVSALCFYYASLQNRNWKRYLLCAVPCLLIIWIFAFCGTTANQAIKTEIASQKKLKGDMKIASKLHDFLVEDAKKNKTSDFAIPNVSYSVFGVKPSSAKRYFHPFYIRWFAIDDQGHFNAMSGFGSTPIDAILKRNAWKNYQYILLLSLDEPTGMKQFRSEMLAYLPKNYAGNCFLFRVEKYRNEKDKDTFRLIPCKVSIK